MNPPPSFSPGPEVLDTIRWLYDTTGKFYRKNPMEVDAVNLQDFYNTMAERQNEGPAEREVKF